MCAKHKGRWSYLELAQHLVVVEARLYHESTKLNRMAMGVLLRGGKLSKDAQLLRQNELVNEWLERRQKAFENDKQRLNARKNLTLV